MFVYFTWIKSTCIYLLYNTSSWWRDTFVIKKYFNWHLSLLIVFLCWCVSHVDCWFQSCCCYIQLLQLSVILLFVTLVAVILYFNYTRAAHESPHLCTSSILCSFTIYLILFFSHLLLLFLSVFENCCWFYLFFFLWVLYEKIKLAIIISVS